MTPLCQHQMPSGKTCQSPALSGQPLCYFHDRDAAQTQFILSLPALTSRASILLALSQVVQAMALNQIDAKRANLLLRSMNLATRLIAAIEKEAKAAQKTIANPIAEPAAQPEQAPTPQPEPVPVPEPAPAIVSNPAHNPSDRLPQSMRERIDAIRRANR